VRAAAQPALVHVAEVRHVEEVLDDARRARIDDVGAAGGLAQARLGLGGEGGQVVDGPGLVLGRGQAHPHHAVGLARVVGAGAVARAGLEVGHGGDVGALAAGLEAPAVVRAFQLAARHAAQRQARAAVRALVHPGVGAAGGVAPQHEVLAQQGSGGGARAHRVGQRHGVPQGSFELHRAFLDEITLQPAWVKRR